MFAEGRGFGEEELRITEVMAHPASIMWAYYELGLLALHQGDLPRSLPMLERAMHLCQTVDLRLWFPWMAATLGAAYTLSGRVADALALLTQAMEQTTAMGNIVGDDILAAPDGGRAGAAGRAVRDDDTLLAEVLAIFQ
jgi:hypothetical protein